MTKIVYNACYGGFSLSFRALERLRELGMNISDEELQHARDYGKAGRRIARTDPLLVQVVEELGPAADGKDTAKLAIAEVPSGTRYRIDEYDGLEDVMTPDDYDWEIAP